MRCRNYEKSFIILLLFYKNSSGIIVSSNNNDNNNNKIPTHTMRATVWLRGKRAVRYDYTTFVYRSEFSCAV